MEITGGPPSPRGRGREHNRTTAITIVGITTISYLKSVLKAQKHYIKASSLGKGFSLVPSANALKLNRKIKERAKRAMLILFMLFPLCLSTLLFTDQRGTRYLVAQGVLCSLAPPF